MNQKQKSPDRLAPVRGFIPENTRQNITTQQRKMPPFSASLAGHDPHQSVRLFFGAHAAWDLARNAVARGRPALCLPVGVRPEDLDWRRLAGRSVVAFELDDHGQGFRVSMVRVLAAWGAREVALIPHDYNPRNAVFWGV